MTEVYCEHPVCLNRGCNNICTCATISFIITEDGKTVCTSGR